ncbi:hypothetical protein ACWY4P_36975 [Streptomyces sp. LZ34]
MSAPAPNAAPGAPGGTETSPERSARLTGQRVSGAFTTTEPLPHPGRRIASLPPAPNARPALHAHFARNQRPEFRLVDLEIMIEQGRQTPSVIASAQLRAWPEGFCSHSA